jgi:hypothetical protein
MTISRRLFALSGAAFLAGCASGRRSDYSRLSEIATGMFAGGDESAAQASAPDDIFARDKVLERPFSQIAVQLGGGNPRSLFVMAMQQADEQLYTLGYLTSLILRRGRIVRTSGFPYNLSGAREIEGADPVWQALTQTGIVTGERWLDIRKAETVAYPVRVTAQAAASEAIDVLGAPIACTRVDEFCEVPDLAWSFSNSYWIGQSAPYVWRSIQNTHPDGMQIIIDLLRPAAAA